MYIIPFRMEVLSDYQYNKQYPFNIKYYVDIWSHIYHLGVLSGISKVKIR